MNAPDYYRKLTEIYNSSPPEAQQDQLNAYQAISAIYHRLDGEVNPGKRAEGFRILELFARATEDAQNYVNGS